MFCKIRTIRNLTSSSMARNDTTISARLGNEVNRSAKGKFSLPVNWDKDLIYSFSNRQLFKGDIVVGGFGDIAYQAAQRLHQFIKTDGLKPIFLQRGQLRRRKLPGKHIAPEQPARIKFGRRLFVFLVFEQASNQFGTGVFLFFIADVILRLRQQKTRFQVYQGRRHQEKFSGDIEVQTLHGVDGRQVLGGDFRNRDIANIHFMLADEVQQKIERTFENYRS